MKLEKEVYINNYDFNCFDYGIKYNTVEFYTENCFKEDEKTFITKNLGEKIKLTLEVEEPILDEAEKRYLSGVIRPFRDKVIYIRKNRAFSNAHYIEILIESNTVNNSEGITLPSFWEGTMYKGMKLNKEYT